ncbi:alpha/beta fold hydrolase [Arthrobacter sp. RIT-PI-e]|uniref:alpha/beta fold hydrolase n=1 Tax=Arthrobacter sp. RIT-PI-e TaxID=1681197 RepID=UPI000675E46E|nr:alpha/beta fold hydrolase [Arthrobacter sp. RIT-PI-e]
MDQHALHGVEGIGPHLSVTRRTARQPRPLPPVLLLHGFGSSGRQNWVGTGWVRYLDDAGRTLIMVDLPGHGDSAEPVDAGDYAPSRMREDIVQSLVETGIVPLSADDPTSGVDVIGYSLGARLAWELGAARPDLVRRMVLGGPGTCDPLASFDLRAAERQLAGGPPVDDPVTADLLHMAMSTPGTTLSALLTMVSAIRTEPFDPWRALPGMPLLLVAGDQDGYATGIGELEARAPSGEVLLLPGRTHANAVTARTFKDAASAFLSRGRD